MVGDHADASSPAGPRRIAVGRYASRYGASPAQVAALAFVTLFLIAFLIVPIVRVIFVAFTDRDGRSRL